MIQQTTPFRFRTEPYKHQLDAFNQFKDAEFFALFADMGTGKSKIIIDIAAYKFLKGEINAVLVLAPNGVHEQWAKEQVVIHCPTPHWQFVWKTTKAGNVNYYTNMLEDFIFAAESPKLRFLCMNIEALQSDSVIPWLAKYMQSNKVFTIIDEATRIKSINAKRTKTAQRLTKYGPHCIATGTPAAQNPFDIFAPFEFLQPNFFGCNYFVFQHRYGLMMRGTNPHTGGKFTTLMDRPTYEKIKGAIKHRLEETKKEKLDSYQIDEVSVIMGVSSKVVEFIEGHEEYTRYKRLDELKELIAPHVFSAKKKDCLDLPEKIYEKVELPMPKDLRKVYNSLKEKLFAEYSGKELSVSNKMVLSLRLMQVCGGFFPMSVDEIRTDIDDKEIEELTPKQIKIRRVKPLIIDVKETKMEALLHEIEEIDENEQIIVWGTFISELELLYEEIKKRWSARLYYGATPTDKRDEYKTAFQKGEYRVFIGNPSTAGFGLNLQNSTYQLYYSNSFRVENRLQAEDRSHRLGVKNACVYKDFIYKNSIDEKVYDVIKTGRELNDYFKELSLEQILNDENEED